MRALGGLSRLLPPASRRFALSQARSLGQAPQGKNVESVESAWEEAKKLFYRPSLTYNEFAKRVECLRLFVFWGLVTGLSLDLALRPLKSSYWFSWNFRRPFGRGARTALPPLQDDNMTDATREYNKICNF